MALLAGMIYCIQQYMLHITLAKPVYMPDMKMRPFILGDLIKAIYNGMSASPSYSIVDYAL